MGKLKMRSTSFLCFFIVVVLMVPTIMLIDYTAKQNIDKASQSVQKETEAIAGVVREDIEEQFTLLGRITTTLLSKSMINILKDDTYDYREYSDIERRIFVENYLYSLRNISDFIDGIYVISSSNNLYYSSNYAIGPDHKLDQLNLFEKYSKLDESEWCVSSHTPWLAWNYDTEPVITIGRKLSDLQGNVRAVAFVDINVNHFKRLLDSQLNDVVFDSYILDSNNQLVAQLNISGYQYSIKNMDFSQEKTIRTVNGKKVHIRAVTMAYPKWKIITFHFDEMLQKTVKPLYALRKIAIFSYLGIYILVLTYVYLKIYKPLKMLTEAMLRIEKGDFTSYINWHSKSEYGYLIKSYNNMLRELNAQINQKYIMEIEKKNAEFNYLKGMINPHFILNTMQSISSMAIINEDYEIEQIVDKFCDILRYSLYNNDWQVSLKDEVFIAKKYFDLKKKSLGWQTELELAIDENTWNFCVIKMVLQPLVENCFYHGFRGNDGEKIIICSNIENDFLVVSVKDNGNGISREKLEKIKIQLNKAPEEGGKTGGIALNNIAARMKILYGDEGKMEIVSMLDTGTKVTLFIPKVII